MVVQKAKTSEKEASRGLNVPPAHQKKKIKTIVKSNFEITECFFLRTNFTLTTGLSAFW